VIQIPIVIDTFNALGANAVPMPLPEVYTALETGAVDGQENPYALIESSKYQEVQKYTSTTRHIYNPLVVLFSKKTWDKMSEDEHRILREAAAEATAYERKVSRETNVAALEKLKKDGMTVTEFPAAETERMREKLKPVADKYAQEVGEPLMKEMLAEIDKVRGR
jgi:TRAP-type C4-dicarboxylate transport system substrate-binding protein